MQTQPSQCVGIMDAHNAVLPSILSGFLNMIDDYQAEAKDPEVLSELSSAYDEIENEYRYIQGITTESRNRIRMTMKHVQKLVAVELFG